MNVWRRTTVHHADPVGTGSVTLAFEPGLEHRYICECSRRLANLLSDMILVDCTETPLLIRGEEVLPELRALRRTALPCKLLRFAVRAAGLPSAVVAPDRFVNPDRLMKCSVQAR